MHHYLLILILNDPLPSGCLQQSAAAAWRRSPRQSLWCAPWSASTTSTASAAACATGSWGRATSLSWRRVSCCARSTTSARRTCWARSARTTRTQVRARAAAISRAVAKTAPLCYHHVAPRCCILWAPSCRRMAGRAPSGSIPRKPKSAKGSTLHVPYFGRALSKW